MTAATLAAPSRYGRSQPARIAEFDALLKKHDGRTYPVEFQGAPKYLNVIRIAIDLPKYRLGNGRTVSLQEEHLARNPSLRKDLFSGDAELLDAQEAQHNILVELGGLSGLRKFFEDVRNVQEGPLVLDENGFVINGNRRLSTWRDLFASDPTKYDHFRYIDVVILPHCDEREIDRLEARLQIAKDIKADYSWDTFANMLHQKREKDGFSNADLALLYDMKESQVTEYLDMRQNAIDYLKSRGKTNMWSEVSDKDFAFRKLVATREKMPDVGSKALFTEAAYVLIERPEDAGGRLYEAIPAVGEYLDEVRQRLLNEFPVEAPKNDDGLEGLFGGAPATGEARDTPLAVEIQKPENADRARQIIVDVIESQKQLKRDSKQANFLLDTCAKANTLLASASKDGLRPESQRAGVEAQLKGIESQVAKIRSYLEKHA
ncbi:hypothetical protein [Pseudoxanthomonas winnipegensis]|uniref:hypothetical protein n=1 Tax=Pseudoxanthomonas winnipegensis TaxID=2480810 RepID=UPI00103CA086|nr:hypothetical protein [Pseudoxanthomonas winnipegensis]TBV74799.1 hypothetical protein EYC45_08755 [Pseudoxanthomonas winnipegensis]